MVLGASLRSGKSVCWSAQFWGASQSMFLHWGVRVHSGHSQRRSSVMMVLVWLEWVGVVSDNLERLQEVKLSCCTFSSCQGCCCEALIESTSGLIAKCVKAGESMAKPEEDLPRLVWKNWERQCNARRTALERCLAWLSFPLCYHRTCEVSLSVGLSGSRALVVNPAWPLHHHPPLMPLAEQMSAHQSLASVPSDDSEETRGLEEVMDIETSNIAPVEAQAAGAEECAHCTRQGTVSSMINFGCKTYPKYRCKACHAGPGL